MPFVDIRYLCAPTPTRPLFHGLVVPIELLNRRRASPFMRQVLSTLRSGLRAPTRLDALNRSTFHPHPLRKTQT